MSWSMAFQYAYFRSLYEDKKIYVRAYRTSLGHWRYGVYASPTPSIQGREW